LPERTVEPFRDIDLTWLFFLTRKSCRRPGVRPASLERVTAWFAATDADAMFVSVATLLEIAVGVRRLERRDPTQGAILRRWKTQSLSPLARFDHRRDGDRSQTDPGLA
jgi:hypothetical protein